MRREGRVLRDYLVQDVEDPRINVQSILTRHFLIGAAFGNRFDGVMDSELRFAVAANWLLGLLKSGVGRAQFDSLRVALLSGRTPAAGPAVPRCVSEAFFRRSLPCVRRLLDLDESHVATASLPEHALDAFSDKWADLLSGVPAAGVSVVEPACGSANDYRFLHAFGLADRIDYLGFDLCEKNVANAIAMFPETRFEPGNVLSIRAPADAFDYCIIHDLFEHLSPAGLEVAIREVCRVTRKGICAGFFNMSDEPEHVVRRVRDYHRSRLSAPRIKAAFACHAATVEIMHIHTLLRGRFDFDGTHNRNAYTLFVRF